MKRLFLFLLTAVGVYAQNQNVTVQPSPGSGGMNTGTFNTYGINYYLAKPATTWDFTQATVLLPQSISGVLSINAGPGIGVNNNTGQVTVSNLGVITLTAGNGLVGTSTAGNITLNNVGVLGLISGNNISITGNGSYPVINATSTTNGTVTNVSAIGQNGIGAVTTNSSTTPVITLNLGDITPSSVTTNALTVGSLTGPVVSIAGIYGVTGQSGSGVPAYNYQPTITSPTLLGTTNAVNVTTNGLLSTTNIKTTGLTGYLYGNDNTGNVSASTTIPAGSVTGLATVATTGNYYDLTNRPTLNAGTVTSVSGTGTVQGISLSGTVTTSGSLTLGGSLSPINLASQVSGTLNVASGGTGVTTSSGANSVVLRDSNSNVSANNFYSGFTNQAASGTTLTLTAASAPNIVITGSGGQTIKLPDATTLPNGTLFSFNNNQSSGTITVQNNSGTTVCTTQSGAYIYLVLLSNGSAAGTWDYHNVAPSNASWSTNTLSWAGSYTNGTWNGNAVGALYGGTGTTGLTGYVYGNGTSPMSASTTIPTSVLSGTISNSQLANNSITVSAGTGLSGGGTVALGGTTTLSNAGVTSVIAGTGVTVNSSTGSVTINATGTGGTVTNLSVTGNSGVLAGVTTPTTTPSISIGLGNITPTSVTTNAGSFTTLNSSGVVNVSNNTASTSTTTGSIVTAGGIGVAGNAYVGGAVYSPTLSVYAGSYSKAITLSGDGTSFQFTGKLIALSDNTYDIGYSSSSYRFRNLFLGGTIVDTNTGLGLNLSPSAFSQSAWGTAGALSQENGTTVTDSSTAASGTATSEVFHSFGASTLAAINTSVTTTDAANVYIAGGVTAGTNQTITNNYGLWNGGNTRIDGNLYLGNPAGSNSFYFNYLSTYYLDLYATNSTNSYLRIRPAGSSGNFGFSISNYGTESKFYMPSASAGSVRISNYIYDTIQFGNIQTTLNPNGSNFTTPYLSSGAGMLLDSKIYTLTDSGTAASGTLASQTNYYFAPITLAATNTGVTTTDAATVRIGGNPTVGTNETITNSWGLLNQGNTRLDGNVKINSSTASSSTTSGALQVAGGVGIGGNAYVGGVVVMAHYTVATLPTASSYTYGECFVSDATQAAGTSIGSSPTGGGSVKRKVYSDGTNWLLE